MDEQNNVDIIQLNSEDGDIKMKYRNFKRFDIVQDYSDHHYSKNKASSWKPTKDWAKKIQQEWKILEEGLPDNIFVRIYEGRMDLLRAVIIGGEGTPYCDGLFFFDVCFPASYPNDPPKVHYHSCGLRINPNLYNNGRVCLSLLNTYDGSKVEKWRPEVSTILQVLVSIQGLVLNAKPYFNEPGTKLVTSIFGIGKMVSLQYNQQALIYSLKTMVYIMRKPPKHFKDLVIGHFHDHAIGILEACQSYYMKGIGVKYGVGGGMKKEVKEFMKPLVGAFKQIGVQDLDGFVLSAEEKEEEKKLGKSLIQRIIAYFRNLNILRSS